MGRRAGASYRKWKTKKIIRVRVPNWTLREDTINHIKVRAKEIGISESRIVDLALQVFLDQPSHITIAPDKFFSKT